LVQTRYDIQLPDAAATENKTFVVDERFLINYVNVPDFDQRVGI